GVGAVEESPTHPLSFELHIALHLYNIQLLLYHLHYHIFISTTLYMGFTLVLFILVATDLNGLVIGLGSMSSIAISYGEYGNAFCGLKSDGSHLVTCYGSNSKIIGSTPAQTQFLGLTAGNGFVCGLLMNNSQPFCWGTSSFIAMGVPKPMANFAEFVELSAGDHHLCGLRKPLMGKQRDTSLVDCWGYNMTKSHVFDGQIQSVSAGSEFNCGLFSQNRSAFCWGDETSSGVITDVPKNVKFRKISAGGYHVCGIIEGIDSNVLCWGTSWESQEELAMAMASQGQVNVDLAPLDPMLSVVGGRFHACGIKSYSHEVVCWGFRVETSTQPPKGVRLYEIASGDYFSCGVVADRSLSPVCWGAGFPTSLPLAVSPGVCRTNTCEDGFYEYNNGTSPCKSAGSRVCLPCSNECPPQMYQKSECTKDADRVCVYNCSNCTTIECSSNCSYSDKKAERFWSLQLPVIVGEIVFGVLLVIVVSITAIFYVRYKLRNCKCATKGVKLVKNNAFQKDGGKIQPDLDELKIQRARVFSYSELERATGGFTEESQVGKGSFSCVFKGILNDGVVVAVKRAILSPDMKKNSMEFHNELDLLSRLNHAHLLNLLGYCEEGNIVEWAVPLIKAGEIHAILDPVLPEPSDAEALKRIANVACKCVRMRGKERPSMDKVTTALERALAVLMGSPSNDQPILPTEVVLGSSRMHKKSSQRSSNRSELEGEVAVETEDQRTEFRAPSWITFPSVASSQRRKSSVSEADVVEPKVTENKIVGDGLRRLEEEIGPASPQQH
ncbi:hypothetical protein M8C21_011245, partial [Ambrosia artemisiifolia]